MRETERSESAQEQAHPHPGQQVPKYTPTTTGRLLDVVGGWISQCGRDIEISENKIYLDRPRLCRGDGPGLPADAGGTGSSSPDEAAEPKRREDDARG